MITGYKMAAAKAKRNACKSDGRGTRRKNKFIADVGTDSLAEP